ncbi:hypothetical protein O1157_27680 [Streptomyces albogriseolus]
MSDTLGTDTADGRTPQGSTGAGGADTSVPRLRRERLRADGAEAGRGWRSPSCPPPRSSRSWRS